MMRMCVEKHPHEQRRVPHEFGGHGGFEAAGARSVITDAPLVTTPVTNELFRAGTNSFTSSSERQNKTHTETISICESEAADP